MWLGLVFVMPEEVTPRVQRKWNAWLASKSESENIEDRRSPEQIALDNRVRPKDFAERPSEEGKWVGMPGMPNPWELKVKK
jgi:hypothetical protein